MENIFVALALEEGLGLPFRKRYATHTAIAFVVVMAGIAGYLTYSWYIG